MAVFDINIHSTILSMVTEVSVILPDNQEIKNDKTTYPVLWLIHGGNGDCKEWLYNSSIVRYAEKYQLAIVLPSVYNSFGMDMKEGGKYASYLENELVFQLRYLFPCLSTQRRDNYVGGASMGGFCAFRWAVNRPDLFCKAGAFAGAILMYDIFEKYLKGIQPGGPEFINSFGSLDRLMNNENDIIYMVEENIKHQISNPDFYMLCGEEDFGFDQNVIAKDLMLQAGACLTWSQVPGVHSYDCWDPYIPEFFEWLKSKDDVCKREGM